MITEKDQIFINNFLKNEVIEFKSEVVGGNFMLDYKMKLVGTKKMISVGDYYDYVLIDVQIVDSEERFKKFLKVLTTYMNDKEKTISWLRSEYLFMVSLQQSIRENLLTFASGGESVRVTINEFTLSDQFYEDIKNTEI
jgi:hypothetical protein